eukprot:GEMP01026954.1.p1 GENE.GEMP01026954.1~~GEMP01026954.1.p1  ORF type:complete len:513 (+),score=101.16 GEMP01026954.1:223-1761(+)
MIQKKTNKVPKAKNVIVKRKTVIFTTPSISSAPGSLDSELLPNERVELEMHEDMEDAALTAASDAVRRDSLLLEKTERPRRCDYKRLCRLSIDTYEKVKIQYDDSVVIYPYRVLELRDYEDMISAEKIESAAETLRNELLDKLVDEAQVDPGTQNLLDRIDDALKLLGPDSKESYDAMVAEKTENKEWRALRYSNALYEGEVDKEALEEYENGGAHLIRHGTGITVTCDGDRYEGQYERDLREGFGWHFWAQGDYYRGQWSNNTMEGKGDYFYADGSWYVGDFKCGLRDGDGTMLWEDGSIYIGQWTDGVFHGDGQMQRADGKSYEGQWQNGKEHGEGLFIQEAGKKLTQYQGEFNQGVPNGKAIVLFSNGDEYFGDLVNGIRTSDEAIYKWGDKRVCYSGSMVKDRAVLGRLRDQTKQKVYEGQWKKIWPTAMAFFLTEVCSLSTADRSRPVENMDQVFASGQVPETSTRAGSMPTRNMALECSLVPQTEPRGKVNLSKICSMAWVFFVLM